MLYHFASLMCVDWDHDLLPYWIEHYSRYQFDTHQILLHSPTASERNFQYCESMLSDAGWRYSRVFGGFNNGELRKTTIDSHRADLHDEDVLVTVDSDEFIDIGTFELRDVFNTWDVIGGHLIDRYDKTLHDASPGPLLNQYSLSEPVEERVVDLYPESEGLVARVRRPKVIGAKVWIPVNHIGSHFVEECDRGFRECPEDFPIYHYSWRETAVERIVSKAYNTVQYAWFVGKMFGMSDEVLRDKLSEKIKEYEESTSPLSAGWVHG